MLSVAFCIIPTIILNCHYFKIQMEILLYNISCLYELDSALLKVQHPEQFNINRLIFNENSDRV